MAFLTPVFAILISPTGSAIYHILTLFALEAAFAIALGHWWRHRAESQSGRLAAAAGLAGLARGILFALGALGASGLFPASAILPPVDRAVTLLTLLLLGWALTFRQGNLFADIVAGLGVIAVIILSLAAGVEWYSLGASGATYNLFDTVWTIAKIAVIGITILALLAVRPADWTFSLAIFATFLIGVALHFFNPLPTENYPAPERMAELIALPLVVVILYRHALRSPPKTDLSETDLSVSDDTASTLVTPPLAAPADSSLKPKPTLTPQAASALAAIALADKDTIFTRITEAVSKTMLADVTLVFAPPDDTGSIICVGGFDLIREISLPSFTLPSKKINTVASAIQRGRPLRMRSAAHRSELLQIADSLGVSPFDSAAMIPLRGGEKNFGGIIICAPHSRKDWTNEEHALLSSLATPIAAALLKVTSVEPSLSPVPAPDKDAEAKVRAAQEKANQLAAELEKARDEINQLNAKTDSLVALIQSQPSEPDKASQEQAASFTQQLTAAQSEIGLLAHQLAAAQKEIKSLNDKRLEEQHLLDQPTLEHQARDERLASEIAALKQHLATAQMESKSLNERLFGAQRRFDEQASEHRTQNERLAEEIDLLKEQLEAARTEIKSLDAQLSDAEKTLAGANETKQKLATTAQTEIKSLSEKLVEVQRQLDESSSKHQAESERLTKEIVSLTGQLDDAHAETASLIEKLLAAEKSAAATASVQPVGTDRLSKELASLKQQLTGADMEIETLRQENKQLSEIRSTGLFSSLASQSSNIIARTQDLRQPLASIIGYTDTLLNESVGLLGKPQRSLLERIKAGTERMNVALDDLARAAAISSTNVKPGRGRAAVADVIENAFTQLMSHFREKNIALRMDVEDDLPFVNLDQDAVHEIISSLLTHACDESKQNSDVVLTAQAQDEDYLLVTIQDSGESISPEEQENIFKRVYSETDAGLSIAKALTEGGGGRIWVESKQDGNTFNVLLPTKNHANAS